MYHLDRNRFKTPHQRLTVSFWYSSKAHTNQDQVMTKTKRVLKQDKKSKTFRDCNQDHGFKTSGGHTGNTYKIHSPVSGIHRRF